MKQVRLIHLLHTLTRCHSRGIYAVNIHSHLWGAVLFLVLLATNNFFVISRYASASWLDSVTFSIFLSSAVFCLTASAVFHTVVCHSEGVCNFIHSFRMARADDYIPSWPRRSIQGAMPLTMQELSVCSTSCTIRNYSLHSLKSPNCRLFLPCIVLCILLPSTSSNLLPINYLPVRTWYVI